MRKTREMIAMIPNIDHSVALKSFRMTMKQYFRITINQRLPELGVNCFYA